jgi:type II secretory pathway pseudopilin PulG
MKTKQNGFSAVETILVLVIVGLLGFIGWYVWHNSSAKNVNASMSKPVTAKNTSDPYAGWQTYNDDHVNFKYPADWQAGTGADKYAAVSVSATSPSYTTTAMTTADNPGASITLSLDLSSNSSTIYCSTDPCTVTAVVPINNSQLPNSALAVVNQTSGNGTKYSQYVVVSNSTKVGDTTINAVKAGTSGIYMFGQPDYIPKDGGLTIAARVSDTVALQSDSHFKNLINLINSVQFK